MVAKKFDLIVIGGGTGGLRTALAAASKGAKTLVVEPSLIGGTCLNTGCIPTKALIEAGHRFEICKESSQFGIINSNTKINFKKLMKRVNDIVNYGRSHSELSIKNNPNLTLAKGKAQFISENKIKVSRYGEFIGKKFIICTGAKNIVPKVTGLDKVKYISNENILEMTKLPKTITLIGGGYISTEFARFFSSLGVKVTILDRGCSILHMLDVDVCKEIIDSFGARKIKIYCNANVTQVKNKGRQVEVYFDEITDGFSKKRTITTDEIFLAIGRKANTSELGLENAKIKTGKRGEIVVNSYLQTSNKIVSAIGDVNGRAMFAHAAKRESKIVLENILKNKRTKMDFSLVPWAVFTDPVVAGVGLSQKQIEKEQINFEVLKTSYKKVGRASIIGDTRGFLKVMVDKKTKNILGVVIVGLNADDIVHEFVALMNSTSPNLKTLKKMIHIHPTVSEIVENLPDM